MEAAGDEQRQTGQHPWWIWVYTDAGNHASLRRSRRVWRTAMMEFKARHAMGRKVTGTALVAHDGLSARYDLNRLTGVFSRPAHKLVGLSYVDRILVLDTAKGGVATAWMLHEMKSRNMVPL